MTIAQPYVQAPAIYRSVEPFEADRIRAAAVYCSDGRFGEQIDEFLHQALDLPHYDRVAIPGGPACFAGHFAAYRLEEGAVEHLQFLIHLHGLRRVALIAHEACGFYSQFLRARPFDGMQLEREDLVKAARRVRQIAAGLEVDGYLARVDEGHVWFESVRT